MTASSSERPLGAATYGYLYATSLSDALRSLGGQGFRQCEIMTTAPHVPSVSADAVDPGAIREALDAAGLQLLALNPTFLDINLASTNDAMRQHSVKVLRNTVDLAADLGSKFVILAPGRLHPLIPAPLSWIRPKAVEALRACVELAEERGVTAVLENIPSGFCETAPDLVALCEELDSPACRILYDVANGHMVEDPADGLRTVADHLVYVHLSDTTTDSWAHSRVGAGDVDFRACADALDEIGYTGPSTLEIIDPDDPDAGLSGSAAQLAPLGWSI